MNEEDRKFLLEVRKFLKRRFDSSNRALSRRLRRLDKKNIISGLLGNGLFAAERVLPRKVTKHIRNFLSNAETANIVSGAK